MDCSWRYTNMERFAGRSGQCRARGAAMGFRGFNLYMPHKVDVVSMLSGLGESAALIGAVNCVVRRERGFIGENTDGKGFLASLKAVINPRGRRVVMFGAGGAARAVAVELALAGAKSIAVVNRSDARGRALVKTLRERPPCRRSSCRWEGEYPRAREGTEVSDQCAPRSACFTMPQCACR